MDALSLAIFNQVIEYNGERTLEGLTQFLETDGEYGRAAPDQVIITNLLLSLIRWWTIMGNEI